MLELWSVVGSLRDGAGYGGGNDAEAAPPTTAVSSSVLEGNATHSSNPPSSSGDGQKGLFAAPQLHHCNYIAERSNAIAHEADPDKG